MVNGTPSAWNNVTSGVPQGTVLGPVLFAMYINDLPEAVGENCLTYMFTDDTKIFKEIVTDEDRKYVQEGLNAFQNWTKLWLMEANVAKCKSMSVSENTNAEDYRYKMTANGILTDLQSVQIEKDIGVLVDTKLTFEEHVRTKVNKANQIMGVIRRSFKYMDERIFSLLYKSMVRPHLEYGNVIWHPNKVKLIDLIENVQRRATKQVPGLGNLPYEDRLKKLKLPTMSYRRLRGDMHTMLHYVIIKISHFKS